MSPLTRFLALVLLLLSVACARGADPPKATVPAGRSGVSHTPVPRPDPRNPSVLPTPLPSGLALSAPAESVANIASCVPNLSYEGDVTIPPGTEIAPGAAFLKTWHVKNSGDCAWDQNLVLEPSNGTLPAAQSTVRLPPLAVGTSADISLSLQAPQAQGEFYRVWRASDGAGHFFGAPLLVLMRVTASAVTTPTSTPTVAIPTASPSPTPTQNVATETPAPQATDTPAPAPTDTQVPPTAPPPPSPTVPPFVFVPPFDGFGFAFANQPQPGLIDLSASFFNAEGTGVEHIEIYVLDSQGRVIEFKNFSHRQACYFGGAFGSCDAYDFAKHNNHWSQGAPAHNGLHFVRALAYSNDNRVRVDENSFWLNLDGNHPQPNIQVNIARLGSGDPSQQILKQDLVFQAGVTNNTTTAIDLVNLQVGYYNRKLAYENAGTAAPYCAFGIARRVCAVYKFKANDYLFPNDNPIAKTMYILRAVAFSGGTAVAAHSTWVWIK